MKPHVEIEWVEAKELPEGPGFLGRAVSFFKGEESDVVEFGRDDPWLATRVLYAYVEPENDEIFYVGKSWKVPVFDRYKASDKDDLWDYASDEFGIERDDTIVLVGFPDLPKGKKLTKELLADLESLLIYQLEPGGNIQSKHSGIGRDGYVCRCTGAWPLKRRTFVDE